MRKALATLAIATAALSLSLPAAAQQNASPFDSSWKPLDLRQLRDTPCEIGVRPAKGTLAQALKTRKMPFGASGMMSERFAGLEGITLVFDSLSEYQSAAIGTRALAIGYLTESGGQEMLMLCAAPTRVVFDLYDGWAEIFAGQTFKG